jgi:hypothetical protein
MVLRTDSPAGFPTSKQEQDALLDAQLVELSAAADRFDAPAIKQTLRAIVPEYVPQDTASVL